MHAADVAGRPLLALRHVAAVRLNTRAPTARPPSRPGGVPTLKHKEVIASPVDRFRLQTEPTGEVHVRVGVITKDFMRYGVSS